MADAEQVPGDGCFIQASRRPEPTGRLARLAWEIGRALARADGSHGSEKKMPEPGESHA